MAGSPSNQDIFDVRKIRRLVELMNEHDLSEMDIRQGDMRIQLRRTGEPVVAAPVAQPAPTPVSRPIAPAEPSKETTSAPAESPAVEAHVAIIKSPMVGTFYRSPSPDTDQFVEVGAEVSDDMVVCIVEAMKVMNEIKADVTGTIKKILVDNATPVQFGQPLFLVEPA